MKKNTLSYNEVINIRRNGRDPETTFGPKTHYSDLSNKSYKEILNLFNKRIRIWYFDVAEALYRKKRKRDGENFTLMILNCIIIDLLSQYFYGTPASDKNAFKNFINDYLLQNQHTKPNFFIQSCSYIQGKWKEEKIKTVADALYHGFRCGLVHSARILEYGRINYVYPDCISIIPWKSNSQRVNIHINPGILIQQLRRVHNDYIRKLRYSKDKELKDNFLKKFELEFGYKPKN